MNVDAAARRRAWAADLAAVLRELPVPLAEVLHYRYFDRLSEQETSARTGLPRSEVRRLLAAALRRVGQLLSGSAREWTL